MNLSLSSRGRLRIYLGGSSTRKPISHSYKLTIFWLLGPACLLLPIAFSSHMSHVALSLFLVTVKSDIPTPIIALLRNSSEVF